MPGFFSCSSTRMLLLLLPLFTLHQSSSAPAIQCHNKTPEFDKNVNSLRDIVKTCPENCSSVSITDKTCQCIIFNVSQEACAFPDSFITSLEFLKPDLSLDNQVKISHLTQRLNQMKGDCEEKKNFCSLPVRYDFTISTISPKTLHKHLEDLMQQYNAKFLSHKN